MMPSAAPAAADTQRPRRLIPSEPGAPGHARSGTGHGFAGMVASAAGGATAPALLAPARSLQAARPGAAAAKEVRPGVFLAPGIPAGPSSTAAGAAPPASARLEPSGKDAGAGPGGLAKVAEKDDVISEQIDGLQTLAMGLADALLPVPAGVGQAPLPPGAPFHAAAALAATAIPTGEGSSDPLSGCVGKQDAKAMLETEAAGGVAASPASAGFPVTGSPPANARPSNAAQPATQAAGTASVMDAAQPGGSGGAAASAPAVQSQPSPVQPSPNAAAPAADGTRTQAGLHPGLSVGIAPVRWTPMTLLREVFAYAQVTSTLLT